MSSAPAFRSVAADSAEVAALKNKTNLASESLGSKIISFSDEFFAEASNLLKDSEAVFLPEEFTDRGKWMDGWETRRHNKNYDWTIIQLGFAGSVFGFDIDTSHFTGNHAPVVSLEAANASEEEVRAGKAQFVEILPKVNMNPGSHHYFVYEAPTAAYTHLRVNNYPDGGIARLRVYGQVVPQRVVSSDGLVDLAFVGNGGRAVACSNQHFCSPSNLVLPGRGKTMGDGWETRRSRTPNHNDWAIIKLGLPGFIDKVEVDTKHFCGNFPPLVTVHGTVSDEDVPPSDAQWTEVLGGVPTTADSQHLFDATGPKDKAFTHVKFTMYPDGGIKRLRIYGRPSN
ncbi:Allantoicase [Coemansia sp. RSA 989]|nr:allantoicase [Coemansia mojavensis]KAJ1740845.1 Allantoicase [Coemansia sp. RSA 1086]KAJ1749170.1 Allantoicase [Coemansia sp. RSA 1821]KAJ1862682.1 Allantoicase [Coemansia sp. RSA 989]KAJ1870909.1 Allantoicase [Coemansia sp. RSA 990]KAJ2653558.1 Allantoicase [Coemansia sp. RSA 1250]KAJ2677273.1 Allantoicase [Coemansia sp. RSA 1085]